MHYALSCLQMEGKRPVTFNNQEYPSLSECPDWVDGVIARTAYDYVSQASLSGTPAKLAQYELETMTGHAESFACYLALTVLEMGDENDLGDYVITAINDLKLLPNVRFAYDSIVRSFSMASYMSHYRKSPETKDRFEFLGKIETHPFVAMSIAFDDEKMAEKLISNARNKFEYTMTYLGSVAHFPYRDSKVRSFLVSQFEDIRDHEISIRLELQKGMLGGRMKAYNYSEHSLENAPLYADYDFKDADLLDLKVCDTPGFDQWLMNGRESLNTLAENLNYGSHSRLEGKASALIPYMGKAFAKIFESGMSADQAYLQACMGYSQQKVALAKQYYSNDEDLHRDILHNLLSKLRDKDVLCNYIAKTFIERLGLSYVLDLVEQQEDLLVIAKHIRSNVVMQRLTHDQRDSLMGHDIGL